jgi:hypothetical protein
MALPVKDPASGKLTCQYAIVEGPVAHLTADRRVSCSFEIGLDDAPEPSQRLQESQLARRLPAHQDQASRRRAIAFKHQKAQRKLGSVPICIPYAEHLSFSSAGARVCQLQESFLSLIEASALLHQHQRRLDTTEEGRAYLVAELQDYRLAYDLAGELLADGLHELSRGARKLLAAIRKGGVDPASFYRQELRQLTGLGDPVLKEYLRELTGLEYVEGFKSKSSRICYRLLIAREEPVRSPLLSPEELERRLACQA